MSISETRGRVGAWIYFWVYVVILYIPILLLAIFSFHDSAVLGLPWKGFSLRWYQAIPRSPELVASLKVSMVVALASSLATVVLGFALGVAIARFRFPGRSLVTAVAIAPMVIPYLALAVALLMTFLAIGLRPSMGTVILGHIVLALPYVLLLIAARAVGLGTELEEAAMDLGGNWGTVLWRVYVPSLRPALLAAFASSFVLSLDEFYLAFFLAGPSQTLPVYFFSGLRRPELLPPTIALVTIVTAATLTVLASVHVLTLRRGPEQAVK